MKIKSKMLLSLSVLATAVAGSSAIGTFAWFSSARSAQTSFNTFTAAATSGDFSIKQYIPVYNAPAAPVETLPSSSVTIAVAKTDSDVSTGDGKNFYTAVFNDASTPAGYRDVTNEKDASDNDNPYYVKFSLVFTLSSDSVSHLHVYLNNSATITKVSGEDEIVDWTRVAITTGTPDTDETNARFYSKGPQAGSYVDGTDKDDDYHATGLTVNDFDDFTSSNIDATKTNPATNPQYLCSIAPGTDVRVNFAIWVEGTLQNSQNDVIGSAVSLTLPFYALDYNP